MTSTKTVRNYESFLQSGSGAQWQRIGLRRRAGVAVPLFSLYSRKSVGIGELPDLKLLIDWCKKTGLSIIQLLPLNDVGFDFTPYDAQSNFALDPMYLSLSDLKLSSRRGFKKETDNLRRQFPAGKNRVNYQIKRKKLELLRKIFQKEKASFPEGKTRFYSDNAFWIDSYAVFKMIKTIMGETSWETWESGLRSKDQQTLQRLVEEHPEEVEFQKWLQWQLFEQFADVRRYSEKHGVLLMGDLPFLVSRDSADVWAYQEYFKLDRLAGAPPDLYFSSGQRWGMPPYHWEPMASRGYDYLYQKLRYAENFYDFFRIDHAVGMFRVWTIALNEAPESGGRNGVFDPPDEAVWEEHGIKLLTFMLQNTRMLPCAEDLGTVPECSYKVLEEFAIPGMDVQRWNKHWETTCEFKKPDEYRKNSIAVVSTHDMTTFRGWWETEVATVDGELIKRLCGEARISFEDVKHRLFDCEHPVHGRLRWKQDIPDEKALLAILQQSKEDVYQIVEAYRGTYGEMQKFWNDVGMKGRLEPEVSEPLMRLVLGKVNETVSIFSVQLLQDWLAVEMPSGEDSWDERINLPGVMSDQNWSWVTPWSLEEMLQLRSNDIVKNIVQKTDRS